MSLGTWQNPYGPGAINIPIFYNVPNGINATVSCDRGASRCAFFPNEWEETFLNGGAVSVQTRGSVWISDSAASSFELNLCNRITCYPTCFQNCTCFHPDGTACAISDDPPELSEPPTSSPTVADVPCARTENQEMCSNVDIEATISPGVDCYCYNFCEDADGAHSFLSCCMRDQMCSPNVCPTGSKEISGCKLEKDSATPSPQVGPSNNSGSTMVAPAQFAVLALASVLLVRQLN